MSTEAHLWLHATGSFLTDRGYHIAGLAGPLQGQDLLQIVPDRIYAVPRMVTRSMSIDGIYVSINAVASGVIGQLGVYGVSCGHYPIPTQILAQEGGQTWAGYINTSATQTNVLSIAIPSAGGFCFGGRRLFWFACTFNGSAQLHSPSYPSRDNRWAIFGYDAVSYSDPLTHLVASWAGSEGLPATFPSTWTIPRSNFPIIAFRAVD